MIQKGSLNASRTASKKYGKPVLLNLPTACPPERNGQAGSYQNVNGI